jgi:toxin ParE1/3/4
MKIIWSRTALHRLIEIEEFIAMDNPLQAEKFILKLINRGESVKDFPYRGRVVPEFSNNEIREVFEKSYRIVYKIRDEHVEILTVFEGHQLLKLD